MPRISVRDAEIERDEAARDFCASCTASAHGDGPYCRSCADYWENDAPLLSDPLDWEDA